MFTRSKKVGAPRAAVLMGALLLAPALLAGCNHLELSSHWRDRLVLIDGKNTEWREAMTYLDDEKVAVGLLNDGEYLYLSLATADRMIRSQVMRMGLTLWFDPQGGKKEQFGIRFPLGLNERVSMREMMRSGDFDENMEELRVKFEESMKELEVLGPGKDEIRRLPVSDAEGIYVKLDMAQGGIVYELRIPLAASEQHPLAIGTQAGRVIGLGLETPEIDWEMTRPPGGGPRGIMGRGVGPPGGGPRGRGGMPRRRQMPEPLDIWARVQLAAEENPLIETAIDETMTENDN